MPNQKSDIIKKLENEILELQGYRAALGKIPMHIDLGPINEAFPEGRFPVGAVHELVSAGMVNQAAATGFIAPVISNLMGDHGVVLWISDCRTIFPPALKHYGIDPHRVVFIDLKNQKEVAWAVDEALKLHGLAAVVGEMADINFMASRRFQLAVEQSQVTGFLFNKKERYTTNACLTRWKITSQPGIIPGELPGVGFPCWKVELLKVRNGRPGIWKVALMNGQFVATGQEPVAIRELHRKTG
ncbi:ImuA family protein [Niastella populi]|uniref:Error-prone repair protein ImuA n=1 Tax=Niastella populi TaxID=550983 RepID=A0A1V9FEY6_9BACT|nr:hypothetical protein [Niastella populi]OQP56786.1 hypothetical protein A4R26_25400 [Niastella populi]